MLYFKHEILNTLREIQIISLTYHFESIRQEAVNLAQWVAQEDFESTGCQDKVSIFLQKLNQFQQQPEYPMVQNKVAQLILSLTPCHVPHWVQIQPLLDSLTQGNSGIQLNLAKSLAVWGYDSLLAIAFRNLIHNAIKYQSLRPFFCKISSHIEAQQLVISFQDNGLGIEPPVEQVFQRRLHPEIPGEGLGLKMVRDILQQHQGTIEIQSSPHGTTFRLRFPRYCL